MEESRKLSGKDLITIGIFSAIYFMLNLAAMFTNLTRSVSSFFVRPSLYRKKTQSKSIPALRLSV